MEPGTRTAIAANKITEENRLKSIFAKLADWFFSGGIVSIDGIKAK